MLSFYRAYRSTAASTGIGDSFTTFKRRKQKNRSKPASQSGSGFSEARPHRQQSDCNYMLSIITCKSGCSPRQSMCLCFERARLPHNCPNFRTVPCASPIAHTAIAPKSHNYSNTDKALSTPCVKLAIIEIKKPDSELMTRAS